MNLKKLEGLITKLREHKEDPALDNKAKGLIGNIIGEIKEIIYQERSFLQN